MSRHFHAVVWIDHREARVFHFNADEADKIVLHPDHPTKHIHHHANSVGAGHAKPDHAYLHAVVEAVADAGAILITGPANAKNELVKHIEQHDPKLKPKIAGVESVDHPSDGQLLALARRKLAVTDRMTPQK